jgi:hypothetical protein
MMGSKPFFISADIIFRWPMSQYRLVRTGAFQTWTETAGVAAMA